MLKLPIKLEDIKKRETPIPIYTTMKIYATVRSKSLIDRLFHLGICISYDRVLAITNNMSRLLLTKYHQNKAFVPSILRKELFTIIAKDNIDLNASSTMIHQHFHGISMTHHAVPVYC